MNRYDIDTETVTGFVIFKDGVPFQAMFRQWWSVDLLRKGLDTGKYWLLPVDGPMPADMALFICSNFAREMVTENINHGKDKPPCCCPRLVMNTQKNSLRTFWKR